MNWNAFGMNGPQWGGYPDDPGTQPPALGLGGYQRPVAGPPMGGNQHAYNQMTYGNYMPPAGPPSAGNGRPEWQPHPASTLGVPYYPPMGMPQQPVNPMTTGGNLPPMPYNMPNTGGALLPQGGGYDHSGINPGGNYPPMVVPGMGTGGNLPPQGGYHMGTGGNDPSTMRPPMQTGGNDPAQYQRDPRGLDRRNGTMRPQQPMNGWGRFMQNRGLVN